MSLNIMCSICMEFYKPDSVVLSTFRCGHLFHRSCIHHWLDNATTCPQCCKHCTKQQLHRVYLNFTERTEADDELDEQFKDYPNWQPLEDLNMRHLPDILKRAVKSGTDQEGHDTYVARVYHKDDLLPAAFVPEKGGVNFAWNCISHFSRESVELLLDCECKWVMDANGHVPTDAIAAGYSELGENLYIGKGNYEGLTILGKVHPSHKVLYMPFNEKEVNTISYEVLCKIKNENKGPSYSAAANN